MGRKSKWNESYIGKQYRYLTIIGLSSKKANHGEIKVICQCVCGKIIEPIFHYLIKRKQASCGCKNPRTKDQGKHFLSNTKLYNTWNLMKYRCNNIKNKSYEDYGGRGIKVCPEWNDFLTFRFQMRKKLIDAKKKYPKEVLSIERIDNDGNYCYDNCAFIPRRLQSKNRRCVKPCKAINRKTGEEVYGKNQLELANKINVSRAMVNHCILGKNISRKWIIKPQ